MIEKNKTILQSKNFQIFIGIILIIILIFAGVVFAINYHTKQKQKLAHEEAIKEELTAFRKYKEKQIAEDIEKINQVVKEQENDSYSDYRYYIDTPDDMLESIKGGYCIEEEGRLFKSMREDMCAEHGWDSVECLRTTKCREDRYTQEGMYRLIEAHATLENDERKIEKAKSIYDEHPNWDLYSIILAAKDSINTRMLKEAALYVWGKIATGKSEKIEDKFEAVWYWKKICKEPLQLDCEGTDVEEYKRDLLAFNRAGTLFYFLLDR